MKRLYPTYDLTDILKLIPGPATPVVNFNKLTEVLLSTDLQREAELQANRGQFTFLDSTVDLKGNRMCF